MTSIDLEVTNVVEKIILFYKSLAAKFISSSKRFPETILLSTSIVLILCIKNHLAGILSEESINLLGRISMILGMGIPVSLSIKVFFERRPLLKTSTKAMIYGATIIGLWLYYIFLLQDMKLTAMIRYTAINISFTSMFLFIPYFYKQENYELYIINLVTRFFITYLYSAILFAGLAAMLATIHALFLVEISHKIYIDIWLIVSGIFAPTFFLGDIPKNNEQLTFASYSKVLKILFLYIIMPLLTAYTITLYVYFAKILVTMQWPEGIVANLVMWYSLISIMVVFFIYPLRNDNLWAKKFIYFFPILVLPLLAMMFVALSMRINAYGITENRYFTFLTGLWLTGCMLYFIVIKKPRTIVLPISIAIVALLSVLGPWSCFSVADASQNARFEKIISKYDILENGKITKVPQDISVEDKREIRNIISYFNRYQKLSALKPLPENFTLEQMKKVFGFFMTNQGEMYFQHVVKEQNLLDINGFDYIFQSAFTDANIQKAEIPISISYTAKNGEVKIMRMGQVIYSGNVNDVALKIHNSHKNNASLSSEEMTVTDQNENIKVVYVIKRIAGMDEEDVIIVRNVDFSLLIKLLK